MKRSSVVGKKESEISDYRTSFTSFLSRSQDKVVQCIEERASKLTTFDVPNIEPLQVVWVSSGAIELQKMHFIHVTSTEMAKSTRRIWIGSATQRRPNSVSSIAVVSVR